MTVRRATVADSDAVLGTIATAFYNDPFWSWVFPDDSRRAAQFRVWWKVFVDAAFRFDNWNWVTENCGSIALWAPPGHKDLSEADDTELVRLITEYTEGDHCNDVLETLARFDGAHPRDVPHYYLSIVATHDDYRGHGYAESMLAENLKLVDAEHMPAYLESSNPLNLNRYMRLGFEPIGEIYVPDNRPAITMMWRPER
jgi:predicted GNAT family N-acyltransferase